MPYFFKQANKNRALAGIGLSVLLIVCLNLNSYFPGLLFKQPLPDSTRFLFSSGVIWVFFIAIYLCATKIEKRHFLLWEENRYTADFYIVWVVALLSINYIIIGLITTPLNNLHWNNSDHKVLQLYHLSPLLKLLGVITAAITEELICRAYLLSRLQLYFKDPRYPLVISALIFAFGHLGYGTMGYIIYTLAFGLLFGWHYQKYRNIKILIICHFLLDYYLLLF